LRIWGAGRRRPARAYRASGLHSRTRRTRGLAAPDPAPHGRGARGGGARSRHMACPGSRPS